MAWNAGLRRDEYRVNILRPGDCVITTMSRYQTDRRGT
jgi:translation initiation factor IF-1